MPVRPTNRRVVEHFLAGYRAMSATLATDGRTLWSYMVPIARRAGRGVLMTEESLRWFSRTTTYHCNLVRAVARSRGLKIEEPLKETGE